MSVVAGLAVSVGAVEDVKAWLRLETDEEDALIEAMIHASILLGEAYVGQLMIRRAVTERMTARRCRWRSMAMRWISMRRGMAGSG